MSCDGLHSWADCPDGVTPAQHDAQADLAYPTAPLPTTPPEGAPR